jgi:SynChlorMet cassette protein ScmC
MEYSCHLVLADGCKINYISRSGQLKPFVRQLVTICNYSDGACPDSQMTVCLDVQSELKQYCLDHRDYTAFGRFFAISFSKNHTQANCLIDAEMLALSRQIIINIAFSMLGSINCIMLVSSGYYSPVHCALLEIYGKGTLVCAPGGTGKSTCAMRLPAPHRALADDCALLISSGNDFIAQALPTWSEIINNPSVINHLRFDCSASVKLSGIFFLEQSTADSAHRLSRSTARSYLNSSFNDQMRWLLNHIAGDTGRELRTKMFHLSELATAELPAYRLCATLNGDFWETIHEALR